MGYTKGEWTVDILKGSITCGGELLAVCFTEDDEINEANAQLIASAPDLYEALKEARHLLVMDEPECKYRLRGIDKALAKAGEEKPR